MGIDRASWSCLAGDVSGDANHGRRGAGVDGAAGGCSRARLCCCQLETASLSESAPSVTDDSFASLSLLALDVALKGWSAQCVSVTTRRGLEGSGAHSRQPCKIYRLGACQVVEAPQSTEKKCQTGLLRNDRNQTRHRWRLEAHRSGRLLQRVYHSEHRNFGFWALEMPP